MKLGRFLFKVLVLGPLLVGTDREGVAAPPIQTQAPVWNRGTLPREVRNNIHFSARDVPGFPEEDPTLLDPARWPATRVINGRAYRLVVDSACAFPLGMIVHHSYTGSVQAGPRYYWFKGKLTERVHTRYVRGRRHDVDYQYDRSGRLVGFHEYRYQKRKRGYDYRIEEWFSRDGGLAGFWVTRKTWFGRRDVFYWLGQRIDWKSYHVRRREYFDAIKG